MVGNAAQRRLAAILVADVVGYSRLMEADELGTLGVLKERRREIVVPAVREHAGRIVKFMGDGILAEFASAVNAVSCALELQLRMAKANETLADANRIRLRIGINLGDIIEDESDVYGDGVNIAARLETLSEPGGICISGQMYDAIQGKLEISVEDIGESSLKNISRTIRAYRIRPSDAEEVQEAQSLRGNEHTTVAVLPFANMSGDPAQDYFSDGITEDIITELSRYQHLSVIARNTTALFKDRSVNVAEIGRKLRADFVIEGSIRQAGNRVRATVQLFDVQTGTHAFAEKFDRKIEDIFQVQDEIVDAILGRLFYNLDEAASKARQRNPTTSTTAYSLWLRGRQASRNGDEEDAISCLNQAIKVDPQYARALAMLSGLYGYRRFTGSARDTHMKNAELSRGYAERAIAADKTDAYVLEQVAAAYLMLGDGDNARRYSDSASLLNPRDISTAATRALVLAFVGERNRAREIIERVHQAEPRAPPGWTVILADIQYLMRDFEGALNTYKTINGAPFYVRLLQSMCLSQLGRIDEAKAILGEAPTGFDIPAFARNCAGMCALAEDRELWLEGFRKAGVDV
ncbi:adenylate/guanylate cyclase domain-containing protein [Mesorhizobium sp. M0047]|uniref:adenylate/guanylate cyclase domain-containing protein n=1 Tax=Mesorhizobium sp. M0047 TaxID=2956859 RepID=UPI00333A1342